MTVMTTTTRTVVRKASAFSPLIPTARATPTAPRRPDQKSLEGNDEGAREIRLGKGEGKRKRKRERDEHHLVRMRKLFCSLTSSVEDPVDDFREREDGGVTSCHDRDLLIRDAYQLNIFEVRKKKASVRW